MLTLVDVMVSDPHEKGSRFTLSLHEEMALPPLDPRYESVAFRAHGLSRERTIELLRRLAARLEAGEPFGAIAEP